MWTMMRTGTRRFLRFLGLSPRRPSFVKLLPFWRPDQDAVVDMAVRKSGPFSTANGNVRAALAHAAGYVARRGVEGSIFLADTDHGGCAVTVAEMLLQINAATRPLVHWHRGEPSSHATLCAGLMRSRYSWEKLTFVSREMQTSYWSDWSTELAFAFLGGDSYEETLGLLRAVWPRLAPDGVLVLEKMGEYGGAFRAMETFFSDLEIVPNWIPIDHAGRLCLKD